MRVCVKTAKGLKGMQNQDSYLVIDGKAKDHYDAARLGMMFAIADGMGGQDDVIVVQV